MRIVLVSLALCLALLGAAVSARSRPVVSVVDVRVDGRMTSDGPDKVHAGVASPNPRFSWKIGTTGRCLSVKAISGVAVGNGGSLMLVPTNVDVPFFFFFFFFFLIGSVCNSNASSSTRDRPHTQNDVQRLTSRRRDLDAPRLGWLSRLPAWSSASSGATGGP